MKKLVAAAFATLALAPSFVEAATIRIPQASFVAGAGLITFSEFAVGTVNPTYAPAAYGGGAGSPTVTFEGYFTGQALGTPATCPPGAAVSGCVVGNPTGPLSLAAGAPNTFITGDGAAPNSPVLSGSPLFNGPIAIFFSVDVAGVGLDGGFFDSPHSTAITAFDRNGNILGAVTNNGTGIEFLGLVTDDGTAQIAGLLFSLVGAESAGFAIDSVRFGLQGQVIVPGAPAPIPEPASLILFGSCLAAGVRRLRKSK